MTPTACLLLLGASLLYLTVAENGSHCFPGLYPCTCRPDRCCCRHDTFGGKVKCHPDGTLSSCCDFICVTYDMKSNTVVVGVCPHYKLVSSNLSMVLPQVPQKLTEIVCGTINRTGTLCGKCDSTTALAVNTYDFKCISRQSCISGNWLLYVVTKLGPLIGFYLIIFLFRINAAAPYISLLILQAQITTTRMHVISILAHDNIVGDFWNRFLVSLYTVWNLDILQVYMPPLCLNRDTHSLDSLALDYLVAVFPLILVLVTYGLAELYARHWWCVFWFFWPLVKLFKCLHINIDPMRSIMNTFATFILLSITKFTVVSINLLTFTSLHDVNGTMVRRVPLFGSDTDYFGGRHLPYAILAIIVLFFCNLLPLLLLLLSPLKCFQQCLRWCCCSFRGVHFVNAFLEVFQGHFKDGVSHCRDYRFVAGLQFLLRFVMLAVFSSTLSSQVIYTCTLFGFILWTVGGLMLRPYKRELYNILEAVLGTYTAFLLVLILYYYISELKGTHEYQVYFYVSAVTPGVLFLLHTILHILRICGYYMKIRQFLLQLFSATLKYFPRTEYAPIGNSPSFSSLHQENENSQDISYSRQTSMVAYDSSQCAN